MDCRESVVPSSLREEKWAGQLARTIRCWASILAAKGLANMILA